MPSNPIDDFYAIKKNIENTLTYSKKNLLTEDDYELLSKDFFGHLKNKLNALTHDYRYKRYQDIKYQKNRIKIIAEGDSWFGHPYLDDIVEQLFDRGYAVLCFSAAGDKLREIAEKMEFLEAVRIENPRCFLLSAGGNDLLEPTTLNQILSIFEENWIDPDKLEQKIQEIKQYLVQILEQVWKIKPTLPILMHGYDYPIPRNEGYIQWIYPAMREKGIVEENEQKAIIRTIIDRFNQLLEQLSKDYSYFHFVDLRGSLLDVSLWHDEIHPNDEGYHKITNLLEQAIRKILV